MINKGKLPKLLCMKHDLMERKCHIPKFELGLLDQKYQKLLNHNCGEAIALRQLRFGWQLLESLCITARGILKQFVTMHAGLVSVSY